MNQPQSAAASELVPAARPDAEAAQDIAVIAERADTRSVMRLGFWVLIVGFGLFLAWAAYAPLDEGVPAPATVAVETRRKLVQHMSGGVVKAVHAREGEMVKAGAVLIELDDVTTKAQLETIRQNYLAQRAMEGRLLAEAGGAADIGFHADLLHSADPMAAQHIRVQRQLFQARRAAFAAEIATANQTIIGLESQVVAMQQALESRRSQAALQSQQLRNVQGLASDGFAPRNQVLQLEQQQAELRASMSDAESMIQRARSSIAETRLRIAQRQQERMQEVSAQLAEVRREVDGNQERVRAIVEDLGRMHIKAPVSGQVLDLAIHGPGAVVTPGQKLMEIVPQGEPLLLDARIPNNVIDRIKVGDKTEVRFSAFANAPQLVVHGKLVSLSADALSEQTQAGIQTYYLGRVQLTEEGRKALGQRVLQPGMTAEVLVKTGERSLLTYLVHPLLKRVASAMSEE